MSKILIIDGTNNFIRNYAAVPTMDLHGNMNGGVCGFLNSLGYFVRIMQPDKIIVCWDGRGGSKKRRAIVSSYKQGRKPIRLNRHFEYQQTNEEQNKINQRLRIGEYLNDLPITQITVDETEADDIIGYLVKYFENDYKIIASNDKDFYQLLNEKTIIFSPRSKLFVNNKYVLNHFRIHPNNFALARAIVGDTTDNLPGIRGIGMKSVVKHFSFLTQDQKAGINQVVEHCEKNKKKYERFLQNKEVIINNLKVMQLSDVLIGNVSVQKIHECLEKMPVLNGTSFRLKLLEDGITSISEYYLRAFKILEAKGKNNGS